MTEITLDKKTFLATLDAFLTRFELATNDVVLAVGEEPGRFRLSGTRTGGLPIEAFGPCRTSGDSLSIGFPITELQQAIVDAHGSSDFATVTLLASAQGIWVKEPEAENAGRTKPQSAAQRAVVHLSGPQSVH